MKSMQPGKKCSLLFLVFFPLTVLSQVRLPVLPDSLFSTYYHQRWSLFQLLPQTKGDIIFLGNSITDGGEWSEMFGDLKIKNRGISGDNSTGVLKRLAEITKRKPAKVFLMIGINDLARGFGTDSVVKNILWSIDWMRQECPSVQLFVQSILPVSDVFKKFSGHTSKRDSILKINYLLKRNAKAFGFSFIDLYPEFCDLDGKLNGQYTNDGLHLTDEGYLLWKHLLYPFVYDVEEKPSILPSPQKLQWNKGRFPLYRAHSIVTGDSLLYTETKLLQSAIAEKGWHLGIKNRADTGEIVIELKLSKIQTTPHAEEAYTLQVQKDKILISATTPHGVFNGIQTLKQLMRDGLLIPACEMVDWPAFLWRGYMVDVGRNFMSMKLLRDQIDVMAAYKLNIFHFHLTEDIAWRLQSKHYPQLTDAKFMTRNPGEYYSIRDLKELIDYCKQKYITLVPEIDMPGHSAAFKRAMGLDMQSEAGVLVCKNILAELAREFDVPFVHIGGDEVKITYKNFLGEMAQLLQSLGKTVIAWDPGGQLPEGSFLQMWNAHTKPRIKFPAIDSRHLYLNHFDPLEAVSATFKHIICDTNTGSFERKGATLCLWPDRRVSNENDIIRMNAVYPVMITFAERCWVGGGYKNFSSVIDINEWDAFESFVKFEKRLMEQAKLRFNNQPFPYVKQADIEWKLLGPFNNSGNTSAVFGPEMKQYFDTARLQSYPSVYGGTIIFRHFWYPMIKANLDIPEANSTWYAFRRIWSHEEGEKDFWIGFNNISRSPNTDSPPIGAWDNKNSLVWVNGEIIDPPNWKRGGGSGNSEIPLIDEGYEYRAPTKIWLQKGWNDVLIKAPVGSFKGEWHNPVKWMFTFVQCNE